MKKTKVCPYAIISIVVFYIFKVYLSSINIKRFVRQFHHFPRCFNSDCGHQALAVAKSWNNAEFLIEAKVRLAGGLKVYFGTGCKQKVVDPIDGVVYQLVADPKVMQLYIPGMHVIENASAWFKLEHRHRLRRDS